MADNNFAKWLEEDNTKLVIARLRQSVEDSASRHAWMPPDTLKEHYYPHPNNVHGEHDDRSLQQGNRNLPAMRV